MSVKSISVCVAVSCLFFSGCKKATFEGAKAMAETEALVKIGPREAGGGGARRASVLLESRLKALGLKTTIDTFSEDTPGGKVHFNNVLARIPGKTNRLIVLASHFDTKSGISKDFQGANDSGSSSGVLMELTRVLSKRGPYETEFMIAFLDGEECRKEYGPHDGLHGSRRLAQQIYAAGGARLVQAVIVLDMVGDKNLNVSIPRNSSPALMKEIFYAAHELGVRAQFSIGPGSILDDHVPFLLAGMPVVDVIDFDYGSVPGKNDYWHTPADTLDKLSVKSMQTVGDVVLKTIENLQ
ncbi:MAG TPA: M28 family peptidase [Pontiellaceae bacterium]|nr:M28 family peptidase [Pontiellaceae bacterium]HPR83673.1 M28 family peptidase [Pontiellaceae bacterium]